MVKWSARRAKQIHERCGIEPQAILMAASHSHCSGPLCGVMPGSYDHASQLVQKLAYEQSTCTNKEYLQDALGKLVDAVCQADAARVASRCGAGKGIEDKVAFNRRFRMRNGLTFTHPGQGNPDIIEPAGPTDPEVGVIGAWNDQGQAARMRRQFRLPCDDESRRHFGQLHLLPGADDSRYVWSGRDRRVPARYVR